MVGAVVTHGNRIVGEGFTSPFGGAHAEVRALDSVSDKSLLRDATLYVTLEPCCHFGKTPPCTDRIRSSGIPRVVVGILDPNPQVAGKGVAILKEAGCEVITGILEEECEEHHRRFLTYHREKRPYIILKWAESADGFLAPEQAKRGTNPEPFWISSPLSRQLAHKWRSEEAAILVGSRTALEDNPGLTTRLWHGANPIRVLIDRDLRVPGDFTIFGPESRTLVFCRKPGTPLKENNVRYIGISEGEPLLPQVLRELWNEQVLSLIVEGGAATLNGFIQAGLWDEARIIRSPAVLGRGLEAPGVPGKPLSTFASGTDQVQIIRHD
jgi:diaminohydroxyphosphoribosylaminopyrimidine deaminase/5-amino-6-(5-phosphoribosylamino)uracil reductase